MPEADSGAHERPRQLENLCVAKAAESGHAYTKFDSIMAAPAAQSP